MEPRRTLRARRKRKSLLCALSVLLGSIRKPLIILLSGHKASVFLQNATDAAKSTQGKNRTPIIFSIGKSGCPLFVYGGLTDPGAPLSPRPGQTKRDTFRFSPCDNYLLSSSSNGAVNVWGIIELGRWTCRGTGQHNSKVSHIEFSQSGVHALTVDCFSIYIWGRDDCGLWSVKAIIPTDNVRHAHFHPAAEHLVVLRDEYRFRIWEMGENDTHETSVSPGESLLSGQKKGGKKRTPIFSN